MTVSSQVWRYQISASGFFSTGIMVMSTADVKVVDVDNTTGQETDVPVGEYSLALTGLGVTLPANLVITLTSSVPAGKTRWVYRYGSDIQDVDYITEGAFDSNAHERAIDRRTLLSIEHLNRIGILGIRAPISDPRVKPFILPPSSVRASKVLAFDGTGELSVITAVPAGSVAFTPNGQQLVEAANFAAMRALLDVEPGVDYQPADSDLTAIAALTHTPNNVIMSVGGVWTSQPVPAQQMPRGHLWGCEISVSGTSVTVSAGERRDQANTQNMTLASPMTKLISGPGTWVAGTGNQGIGDTILTNTWYHVFLIRKNDGSIDVGLDRDPNAVALLALSTYNQYRRLGSIFRTTVPDARPVVQDGDTFLWVTPVLDVDDTNPGTGGVTKAISVPPDVKVLAMMKWNIYTAGSHIQSMFSSLDQTDLVVTNQNVTPPPSAMADLFHDWGINAGMSGVTLLRTNTLRQIRYRMYLSDATIVVRAVTAGWIEDRGRNK